MSFVGEAKELIEPMAKRMKLRRSALMPFANQTRGVTRILKRLRNRDLRRWQANPRTFIHRTNGIEFVAETRGSTPGQ